jgi:hypothetical protein
MRLVTRFEAVAAGRPLGPSARSPDVATSQQLLNRRRLAGMKTGARPRRLAGLLLLAWPAAFALRWWAESSPARVEALFARGLYPRVAGRIAWVTAWTPLSVAEVVGAVLLLAAVGFAAWGARAAWRRQWPRLGAAALRLAALAGLGYLLFLLQWGLNYQRQPVAAAMGLRPGPRPTEELAALASELVAAANALRGEQLEDSAGVTRVRDGVEGAFARTRWGFERAAQDWPVLSGSARPKGALSSLLLAYSGISGIYVPFTAEPHVNRLLPESEIPFTAAHEMAHHVGFAREDEANFLAWVACRAHPDADFRYSGALRASIYASSTLRRADAAAADRVESERSPAVRRDLAALAAWRDRYRSRAADVQARVNDAYLRSHGQREGIASYGRMVDLLLAERAARISAGRPTAPAAP